MTSWKTLACLFLFLPMLAQAGYVVKPFYTPSGFLVWAVQIVEIDKVHAAELSEIDQIKNFIITWSQWNEVDYQFMLDLAKCESGFKPDAKGDYVNGVSKAYGLYQWWQASWNHYNKEFKTDLERTDWHDQVRMSVQVVKKYGSGDWFNCGFFIENGYWYKKPS